MSAAPLVRLFRVAHLHPIKHRRENFEGNDNQASQGQPQPH
jgi:hypothetical protein